MHKNRLRGAKGGRAGKRSRSPFRSKPGSVEPAVVPQRWVGLSQEVCVATRRKSRLGASRDAPSTTQKSAQGVVAMKAGKSRLERRPERCVRVDASKQGASKPNVAVTTRGQPDSAHAGSSALEQSGEATAAPPSSVRSERASERQESPSQNERLMEQVADRANLNAAWRRVRANDGAPGIDGITVRGVPGASPRPC